jgi:transcriptional regulator
MYISKLNQVENQEEIFDFIKKNGFATLISVNTEGVPFATHIPITLEMTAENTPILRGHVSKANPHEKLLAKNPQALAIFQGAHAYISSSWYSHENVSTWNYSSVHVYGTVRILTADELFDSVKYLTAKYEAHVENPKYVDSMPPDFVKKEIRGILGFEMTLDTVQAAVKMSQNRKDVDYQNILTELEKTEDGQAHGVAQKMREIRPVHPNPKRESHNNPTQST